MRACHLISDPPADETGGADINKAAKYILWRFTQTNRARLSVYPHLTQATDTSNVSHHFVRTNKADKLDPIGIRSSQRDDSTKRPKGQWDPIILSSLLPLNTAS